MDEQLIEKSILALGSEPGEQSPVAPGVELPPAAAPSAPAPQSVGAAPSVPTPAREVRRYAFPSVVAIPPEHQTLLDQYIDPEKIPHLKFGRWKGCQCLKCKTGRGEVSVELVADLPGAAALDPVLSELMSEEFCALILNVPNRALQLYAKTQKAPAEVLDLWDTDRRELEQYGKFGKRLADHYLSLPEFQHKELILFGSWYMATLGTKIVAMKALMGEKR